MRIQNNQPAFNTWTSYTSNVNMIQKSMKRLSTGLVARTDDSPELAAKIKNSPAAEQQANPKPAAGNTIDITA